MSDSLDVGAGLELGWCWTEDGFPDFTLAWRGVVLPWDPVRAGSWMLN